MTAAYDLDPRDSLVARLKEASPYAKRLKPATAEPVATDCKRNDGACQYTEGYCEGRKKCVDVELLPYDPVNLKQLESELSRNRLEEIKTIVRALTYEEMMIFAAGIWDMRKGEDLTDDNLPAVLHRWATAQELK